jgi:WD40 repeat protein
VQGRESEAAMRVLTATKTAIIDQLAFAPDGSRLAAACTKSNARVWDLASGRALALKGTRDFDFVGFARGPDELVLTKWDTPASLHELGTGVVRRVGRAPGYCWDTDLSPDGQRLVRVERAGIICRAVADGRTLWTAPWQRGPDIHERARFDGGGTRVFFVSRRVTVLDAGSGSEVGGFDLKLDKHPTLDLAAVSPDGRWLAVRGSAGLQVHDTTDGRLVLECPHITYGYGLAFTPDGSRLAATRFGGPSGIEFWSVPGWQAGKPWTSSIVSLRALAFSRDGRLAAAGGFGGQVALWDFE